jgi:hypothetical protein
MQRARISIQVRYIALASPPVGYELSALVDRTTLLPAEWLLRVRARSWYQWLRLGYMPPNDTTGDFDRPRLVINIPGWYQRSTRTSQILHRDGLHNVY